MSAASKSTLGRAPGRRSHPSGPGLGDRLAEHVASEEGAEEHRAAPGPSYANHLDETGTLAVGKLADLAILDRDLFDAGQGAIGQTTVPATFVEGVSVHEIPGLDG